MSIILNISSDNRITFTILQAKSERRDLQKANGLKPYEYFKYLLQSMLDHLDDNPADYIDDLLPWSDKIPEYCRLKKFE